MTERLDKTKIAFAILIMSLMIVATRGHSSWVSAFVHLPDFTLPALFIAGVYLRNILVPIFLIALAMGVDWYVITYNSVSDFCVTDAYSMLVPAYLAMYFGGSMLNSLTTDSAKSFVNISAVVMTAGFTSWLISSASFYWMAPYFTDPSIAGFMPRIEQYAPSAMMSLASWMLGVVTVFSLNERYSFVRYFTSKNSHA